MKRPIARLWVGIIGFTLGAGTIFNLAYAQTYSPNELTFIQVKMTGSETIVVQNTATRPLNLSNYLLEYFNKHNPASLSAPTEVQQLPDMTLAPKQAILFNSDSAVTCGAAAVSELEFTMSDSSGYLALMRVEPQSDGSLIYRPQDDVSWTSSSAGADLVKVPSATADPKAVWYRKIADGSWLQAQLGSDCGLLSTMIEPADTPTYAQWATGEEPPATIVSTGSSGSGIVLSAANIGLAAPLVTELLPNTASPQTDSEDEFIELYNSNSKNFDLSGFALEVGLTTKRKYTFPAGTILSPKSFKAFFSSDTGLALSNTGSQVSLLDPSGNTISGTDAYASAKDGQSWALANGKWYWSSQATPNAANIIKEPAVKGAATKSTASKTKSSGVVKGASTTKAFTTGATNNLDPAANTAGNVHPLVLAGVGAGALLYGLYEYRNDVANQIHRLRRYREARRTAGS